MTSLLPCIGSILPRGVIVLMGAILAISTTACGAVSKSASARTWIQVHSDNFHVISSLDEKATVRIARQLETLRAATSQVLAVPLSERSIPTKVYVFRHQTDWDQYAPSENLGGFFHTTWRTHTMAINSSVSYKSAQLYVYHEYLHRLLEQSGSPYPLWYEEGVAEFFSTAELDANSITLGTPPPRFGLLRMWRPERFKKKARVGSHIVRQTADEKEALEQDMFYARAWARVNYLYLSHLNEEGAPDLRQPLYEYLAAVLDDDDPEAVFAKTFGMTMEEFDERVEAYVRRDKLSKIRLAVNVPQRRSLTATPLSELEIAQELGGLAFRTAQWDTAEGMFAHALTLEPENARALSGLAHTYAAADQVRKDSKQSTAAKDRTTEIEALFAQALERADDDPFPRLDYAAYALERIYDESTETLDEGQAVLLEKARAQAKIAAEARPNSAEAHALLGLSYALEPGKASVRPGIRALNRANQLLPRNPLITYHLATLALRAGMVDDAHVLLRQVTQSRHGGAASERARSLLAEIENRTGRGAGKPQAGQ